MVPAGPVTESEAHNRYPGLWDTYLGVIAVAVAVAVLGVEAQPWRRVVAIAAIAGIAVLHALLGRAVMRRQEQNLPLLIVELVLFAVAVVAAPVTNWLLFAIIPLTFQMVPLRTAAITVVAVNLVPAATDAVLRPEQVPLDLVIAVISSASGIWLGFWITRVIEQSVERRTLVAELESSRAEVARLSHEAGVAAERTRLAGEIHDTLAQGFMSIITLLQAADPTLRDERLALAVRTARENLAEARALVAALSPSALGDGSLPDAVRRQTVRFTEESGLPCGFRVTGDERVLPTAVQVVLLRAAQEALTNVRRHAAAREASVVLGFTPTCVRLVVRDDGRGFTPPAADGYGLTGMRQRTGQVDGTLTVRSDESTGTTIEVEVPA